MKIMAMAEIPNIQRTRLEKVAVFDFHGFSHVFLLRDMARKYQIDMCDRRVTKKNSQYSPVRQQKYGTWKRAKFAIFQASYLCSPIAELDEKNL